VVIDILVQPKRDRWAALRFFRKLLHVAKRPPRVIITDKLRSYAAAKKLIMPDIEHRQSRYLNNRAEELTSTNPHTILGSANLARKGSTA
jgi:putative transposase